MPPVRGPGASEDRYEHPWGSQSHAAAKLARPAAVRDLFGDDRLAHCDDVVSQLAMQALALRRQLPFLVGQPTARRLVPLAVVPGLAALCAASLLVIVLRVVGPQLSVQLALQAPFHCYSGGDGGAKQAQACLSELWHDGNGGGS